MKDVPANPDATAILLAGVDFMQNMGHDARYLNLDENAAYARAHDFG